MDQTPNSKSVIRLAWWIILPASLVLLTVLRLNVSASSAHMDEYDYLFVGKQLMAGLTWPTHTYIFGSDLSWYLFGFFDEYAGGITGARSAAGCLGILSLIGTYFFVVQLWSSRKIAVVTTLFLAISAQHIFISALATYDIVSLCFFIWTLATAVYTARTNSYTMAIVSAVFFALAILCKYNTAVYLPLIGIAMMICAPRQTLLAGAIISAIVGAYIAIHFSDLATLYRVQIAGVHAENSTRADIAIRILKQLGLPLYLSLCAVIISAIQHGKQKQRDSIITLAVLLAFSLPMPAYHLYSSNHISLYKHLNYSALFLYPAAAYLLVYGSGMLPKSRSQISAVSVSVFSVMYAALCFLQLDQIKNGYPDTREIATEITSRLTEKTTALTEDPYLIRYIASGITSQSNIKETGWLDNNLDGIHSTADVKDALWDRKFELVLLTDQIHPTINSEYRNILSQRDYKLIYEKPYVISDVMTKNTTGKLSLYTRGIPDTALLLEN